MSADHLSIGTQSVYPCVDKHVCIGCAEILGHAFLPLPDPVARVSPSIRHRMHFDHTLKKLGGQGQGKSGELSTARKSRGLAPAHGLTPPCSTFEVPHSLSDGRGKGN